jgi:AcrR family transcriptional regulator
MAEKGYEAATVAALVKEAGIPPSSIYHYFGSKEGVLLAVMERGAERFFEAVPIIERRSGTQAEHLRTLVEAVSHTLERHPDFLRILVVMATQPMNAGEGEVHRVVNRVRELALERLRIQMNVVFGLDPASAQAEPLEHLPAALIAVRRELA